MTLPKHLRSSTVRLLGTTTGAAAEFFMLDAVASAQWGKNVEAAECAMEMCAEALRHGKQLPESLMQFVGYALGICASMPEACARVAGSPRGPGRKTDSRRDAMIVLRDVELRAVERRTKARLEQLGREFGKSEEAIRSVLRRYRNATAALLENGVAVKKDP